MVAQQAEARERLATRAARLGEVRESARLRAQMEVLEARENAMALALIALLVAAGGGAVAVQWRRDPAKVKRAGIAAGLAGAALIAALLLWLTRPGLAEIEDRVAAAIAEAEGEGTADGDARRPSLAADGTLICSFLPERSRVTAARTDDVELEWRADGCVNGRTQYGLSAGGAWSRVLVLEDEAAVAGQFLRPPKPAPSAPIVTCWGRRRWRRRSQRARNTNPRPAASAKLRGNWASSNRRWSPCCPNVPMNGWSMPASKRHGPEGKAPGRQQPRLPAPLRSA